MRKDLPNNINQSDFTKKELVEIYEAYSPRLFAYAFRLLGDSNLAEDCVSETFSRLLQVIKNGGGPTDNLKAYLYRISHNWIVDYYRNRVPKQEYVKVEHLQNRKGNPEAQVSRQLEQEKVRNVLLGLPEDQRQVIMLRFYEDWSHAETAAALGRSEEASRALQYRALENLRRMLLLNQGKGVL